MQILDHYIRLGFDLRVKPADEKCLFTVFEDDEQKHVRWEDELKEKIVNKFKK